EGTWSYTGPGYTNTTVEAGDLSLRMASGMQLEQAGARVMGRTTLREGESTFVALSWGDDAPATMSDALDGLRETEDFWRGWLSMASIPDHRYRPFIERSALALKG